jgi:hypothetical protein
MLSRNKVAINFFNTDNRFGILRRMEKLKIALEGGVAKIWRGVQIFKLRFFPIFIDFNLFLFRVWHVFGVLSSDK